MSYEWHFRQPDNETVPDTYPDDVTGKEMVFVGPKMDNQEVFGPIPAFMVDWATIRCWRLAHVERVYS